MLIPRLWRPRLPALVRSVWEDDETAAPEALPLVKLTFENAAEGPPGLTKWTNEGTAAFQWTINGTTNTRSTAQKHSGAASCLFIPGENTTLSYGGAAMDLGVHPLATWRMFYRPTAAPSSFAHSLFCWGNGVTNRFLPFIVLPDLKVQTYCIRANSTKWNVASAAPLVTLNAWNEFVFLQDGAGAFALVCNGVSVGSGTDGDIDFSAASFGNMTLGRESWTSDNFCEGYIDDVTITVGG